MYLCIRANSNQTTAFKSTRHDDPPLLYVDAAVLRCVHDDASGYSFTKSESLFHSSRQSMEAQHRDTVVGWRLISEAHGSTLM